jgi:hypothetical protein
MLKPNSITKNPAIIHKDFHDSGLKHMTPPSDLCGFLPPFAAMTKNESDHLHRIENSTLSKTTFFQLIQIAQQRVHVPSRILYLSFLCTPCIQPLNKWCIFKGVILKETCTTLHTCIRAVKKEMLYGFIHIIITTLKTSFSLSFC